MSVLVLAAHPDDEVLGCGGVIARLAGEGHDVDIAILGEGITARYESRELADSSLLAELRTQAQRVAQRLGARELCNFEFPDNRFDTVPLLDVVKTVEGLLQRFEPVTVFTHHGGDLNVDHQVVNRATLTATRPMTSSVKRVYAYSVGSSTEWSFQQFAPWFQPTNFFDIGASLDDKVSAMLLYDGESRAFPHPRSEAAIRATAKHWGSVSGMDAAEPFQLIRECH